MLVTCGKYDTKINKSFKTAKYFLKKVFTNPTALTPTAFAQINKFINQGGIR